MPITPGRPHSPTIHPRTRPEATEYAAKMRGTNDWFRHDGKNVEKADRPPPRLQTRNAKDIATKNKGEPDQWFQHNSQNEAQAVAPPRCPTAESRKYHDKIYGKEEAWYKHEENRDYFSPRGVERLAPYGPSHDIKEKNVKADTMDWYKHEHAPGEKGKSTQPKHRTPSKNAEENERKLQGRPGTPEWFTHNPAAENGAAPDMAQTGSPFRLTHPEAGDYQDRNRHGSAADWYQHSATPEPQTCNSPRRVTSKEGEDIAKCLGNVSENWFDYEANKAYRDQAPGVKGSTAAREMVAKSRGDEMEHILTMSNMGGSPSAEPRVKPEAQEIAQKNIQGLMDKYLKQDRNRDYASPRPAPRVKPEAEQTFEKNKGIMSECMGGYPDAPAKKDVRRVKPEAEDIAKRNKGLVDKVITGELAPSKSSGFSRAVKAEAVHNMQRNQGTLKNLMESYGELQVSGRPVPRLNTTAAKEIAEKNKGTLDIRW